ncbi:hypothetical protein BC936DRAFT_150080 [Jimgerdemannia flammicorona]|uniref:G domain-containing protein n=1 Tax=Jimgerdemannia flammicorona TaxID=994334 RepID=A0A433CZK6_9FUNG|nr:hypothetical protein BC936DRAFT_150080 [Jimgerdemannia flammicorona]
MPPSSNISEHAVKCVLAIGDTGNGKSFTATVFGATAEVGHGPSSMTNKVKVHRCVDNRFVYIDTPGFNDSNPDKADQDTARSILITMRDAQPRIEWVHTILWFVDTTDRAKATFQRQAGLIRDLASYHNGNVWDNVIVVIKGLEIDDQCVNAIKTACYPGAQRGTNHDILINLGVFKVWLYDRLPERSVYRRLNPDERANCGIYTNEELLPKYIELMQGHEQHQIKILFQDATCQKCGEVTDPRIASSRCHVKRIMAHQPGFTQVHPKGTMKAHARNSYIVPYHPNPNKESYHPSTELVHRMPHLRKEHDSSAIIVKRHTSNRLVHSRGFIGKHSDTCQKLLRHKDMGMTHTGRQVEDARDLGAGLNLLGFVAVADLVAAEGVYICAAIAWVLDARCITHVVLVRAPGLMVAAISPKIPKDASTIAARVRVQGAMRCTAAATGRSLVETLTPVAGGPPILLGVLVRAVKTSEGTAARRDTPAAEISKCVGKNSAAAVPMPMATPKAGLMGVKLSTNVAKRTRAKKGASRGTCVDAMSRITAIPPWPPCLTRATGASRYAKPAVPNGRTKKTLDARQQNATTLGHMCRCRTFGYGSVGVYLNCITFAIDEETTCHCGHHNRH